VRVRTELELSAVRRKAGNVSHRKVQATADQGGLNYTPIPDKGQQLRDVTVFDTASIEARPSGSRYLLRAVGA
jgi:hypothetical protein